VGGGWGGWINLKIIHSSKSQALHNYPVKDLIQGIYDELRVCGALSKADV
jgi:hypothetical protein